MDQLDLDINETLSVLAAVVNGASRPQDTSAEAVKVVTVPLGLLYQARKVLERWAITEYQTDKIKNAVRRTF
jgi:hypothetical protein